jgi:putative oxidoreductase
MLGAIFVVSGARAMARPDYHDQQAKQVTDWFTPVLEKASLPTETRTLIRINGAVQLVGALLLATGRARRPAALALAASLVPTTAAGHPFWSQHDREQRREQQVHFLKNMGLFGGLLLAALDNEGRPGLRWRTAALMGDTRGSARRVSLGAQRQMATAARRQVEMARRQARMARRIGRRQPSFTARAGQFASRLASRLPG